MTATRKRLHLLEEELRKLQQAQDHTAGPEERARHRLQRQREALVALFLKLAELETEPDVAVRELATQAASALAAAAVGVWKADEEANELRALTFFLAESKQYQQGAVLSRAAQPALFATLEHQSVLGIADIVTDPRLRDATDAWLGLLPGSPLLLASTSSHGHLNFVLTVHRRGPQQAWEADEENFALALCGFLHLTCSQRLRS